MRSIIALLMAAALLAVGLQGAQAGTGRYTRGDAEAMLNTYPQTAQIFLRLPGFAEGLDIRPFQEFYGDVPYCVEDWHVLALAFFVPEIPGAEPDPELPTFFTTREDAWAFLDGLEAEFLLDGVPIDVQRSPIKLVEVDHQSQDFPGFPFVRVWGLQWGRILAPEELSVAEHTFAGKLEAHFGGDTFELFASQVKFTVYPADSPACTS